MAASMVADLSGPAAMALLETRIVDVFTKMLQQQHETLLAELERHRELIAGDVAGRLSDIEAITLRRDEPTAGDVASRLSDIEDATLHRHEELSEKVDRLVQLTKQSLSDGSTARAGLTTPIRHFNDTDEVAHPNEQTTTPTRSCVGAGRPASAPPPMLFDMEDASAPTRGGEPSRQRTAMLEGRTSEVRVDRLRHVSSSSSLGDMI